MALWRFFTWFFVIFALLLETRAAYGLAAAAVILFYILPHLLNYAVQNLVVEYPQEPVRLLWRRGGFAGNGKELLVAAVGLGIRC